MDDVAVRTKEDQLYITTREYFQQLKDSEKEMTELGLEQFYANCMELKDKFVRLGQIDAIKRIIFLIDSAKKEKLCLDQGINLYVNKEDIIEFSKKVTSEDIGFIELSRYEREIPDEVVEKVERVKDVFDNMYVLFTDYSKFHQKKYKKENDPILFGTFEQEGIIHGRYYVIADWVDEYCDLTLERFVTEFRKYDPSRQVTHSIEDVMHTDELKELRESVAGLEFNRDTGLYEEKPKENKLSQLWTKIKGLFR